MLVQIYGACIKACTMSVETKGLQLHGQHTIPTCLRLNALTFWETRQFQKQWSALNIKHIRDMLKISWRCKHAGLPRRRQPFAVQTEEGSGGGGAAGQTRLAASGRQRRRITGKKYGIASQERNLQPGGRFWHSSCDNWMHFTSDQD